MCKWNLKSVCTVLLSSTFIAACQHKPAKVEAPQLGDCRPVDAQTERTEPKQGEWICFYKQKKILQAHFKDGLKHGEAQLFDENEKLESITFWYQGLLHGPSQYFDKEGRLDMTIQYQRGKLNGETLHFYPDGKIKAMALYQDGILFQLKEFDPTGKLIVGPEEDSVFAPKAK